VAEEHIFVPHRFRPLLDHLHSCRGG
jgi:hypothetical protein